LRAPSTRLRQRALSNKGAILLALGEVTGSGDCFKEGARVADRLGLSTFARQPRAILGFNRYLAGAWDEAVEYADAFLAECEAGSPSRLEFEPIVRARIRLARGRARSLSLPTWPGRLMLPGQ
jgi:hypothetical protein